MSKTYTVIVTYNAIKWIKSCLDSIKNQSEIIVVDNNSSDNTLEVISENYKDVIIIKSPVNLGFGKANNLGISKALDLGAQYVFLLNQDVYVQEKVISNLISAFDSELKFGIISPVHCNGSGNKLDFMFGKYLLKNSAIYLDALRGKPSKTVYEVSFVNAAAWMISKECLEHVGGFDPVFFHYGEDENYCQRLIHQGFKIGVMPSTFIFHDREQRIALKKEKFSDKYFVTLKKVLLVKYANINHNFEKTVYQKEIAKTKVLILKSLLLLKHKDFFGYIKQHDVIKKLEKEILNSRRIYPTKGKHFLS